MSLRTKIERKWVRKRGFALLLAQFLAVGVSFAHAQSPDATQPPTSTTTAPAGTTNTANNSSAPAALPSKPWIVRDPATGRVFQQQLVPVTVPVTRWEPRTIEQTVYEPRISTQVQQAPQTTYTPNTQYVMQPKVTGWWNPFKPPVQAYQYVPVTNWVPQTQQVPNPVTTQQWVPRQQKVVVYQQVQATEVRQQLVQTELPQPQSAQTQLAQNQSAPNAIAAVPTPRQPLFRLPILAQQRVLPWAAPTYGNAYSPTAPTTSLASQPPAAQTSWQPTQQPSQQPSQPTSTAYAPVPYAPLPYTPPMVIPPATPPSYAASGLRPVSNPLVLPPISFPRFASSPYSAPLQTTTSVSATASRDTFQSGMQPTVLR